MYPVVSRSLNRADKSESLHFLMFSKQKLDGSIKGRRCADVGHSESCHQKLNGSIKGRECVDVGHRERCNQMLDGNIKGRGCADVCHSEKTSRKVQLRDRRYL